MALCVPVTVSRGRRHREARRRVLDGATHCTWCHCEISDLLPAGHPQKAVADHLTTVVDGGLDVVDNYVPACWTCNARRRGLTVEQWVAFLARGKRNLIDDW